MAYQWTTNLNTPVTVDGQLGPQTLRGLQFGLGLTTVAGGGTGVFDTNTIKAFQTYLKVTVDGQFGPLSTKALQQLMGVPLDGSTWGTSSAVNPTTTALQKGLNAGNLVGAANGGTGGGGTGGGGGTPTSYVDSVAIDNKTGISYARWTSGGTVSSWIASACAARGITDPTAISNWTNGFQTAISRESSGDANACNTNDSNDVTPPGFSMVSDFGTGYGNPNGNLNGQLVNYQCSRGVVQCIPQTFAANHCPGTSGGIYDPVANICASMGYVRVQYGVSADGSDLASKVQQFDPNRPPAGY